MATGDKKKSDGVATGKKREQSENPPGGLEPEQVPMFVTLGFDDNGVPGSSEKAEGMYWALEMLKERKNPDRSDALASFYVTSSYATGDENSYAENPQNSPVLVKRMWHRAFEEGHEIGNHTHTHPHGKDESGKLLSVEEWKAEMEKCNGILTLPFDEDEPVESPDSSKGAGIDASAIVGFRTPFLEYTDNTFKAVTGVDFLYDCSMEEGIQPDRDGTDYYWPYTLDEGSEAHKVEMEWGLRDTVGLYPGLWEMPVYSVIVPPDEKCSVYGVEEGLRQRLHDKVDYFDPEGGKITGFDYNLWVLFEMTAKEFEATLKYSFDLRMDGNRAPFLFGMHSDIYADGYPEEEKMKASSKERREAVERFLDYVLEQNPVRIVSAKQVLNWVQKPSAL